MEHETGPLGASHCTRRHKSSAVPSTQQAEVLMKRRDPVSSLNRRETRKTWFRASTRHCYSSREAPPAPPLRSSPPSPEVWAPSTARQAIQALCTCETRQGVCTMRISSFQKLTSQVSVASLNVTNARNRTLLNITPNSFPATRYNPKRELGDDSVIEYIQVQFQELLRLWAKLKRCL